MVTKNEKDLLVQSKKWINNKTSKAGIHIDISTNHLLSRARERDISIISIRSGLHGLIENHLCYLTYLTYLDEKLKPMTINIRMDDCIVVLGRCHYKDNSWVAKTVLDPKLHNKHNEKPSNWEHNFTLKLEIK